MSKAVLISIKPKWVEKIASGEKTVEVRRTAPQLLPPFKCYIYATKATKWFRSGIMLTSDESLWLSNGKIKMCDGFELWANGEDYQCVNGKVIGEFVCNMVDIVASIRTPCMDYITVNDKRNTHFSDISCLNVDELGKYLGFNKDGYGWHISDLKIYDKPRELSEFATLCNKSENRCANCEHYLFDDDGLVGYRRWCDVCHRKPLARAPQSWCYVEVINDKLQNEVK